MALAKLASRRHFLRGRIADSDTLRPPWSIDESLFVDQCRRCNACVEQCGTDLLVKGSGGFPEADYSKGFCTFCEKCVEACEHQALVITESPWQQLPVITDKCLAMNKVFCRTCEESCEVEAIRFQLKLGGIAQPLIENDLCTGCGECIADCPVQALVMKKTAKKAA
ncbi:ferredoxin-type protein NapF [Endozoicomonas sp. OPT23]|uniref:ferredoxin-type protein NapF n=1 Tax=Endozoicomonas sp. OPT23 TaxID=2072845 RepID=UPI00129B6480|nr:ferredoxin-type protein NapF [Endozoicomonas sp. OPT23]MRI32412.1 ferredoxin-type protein NapF [Endozoicomonas sp. OPT23]